LRYEKEGIPCKNIHILNRNDLLVFMMDITEISKDDYEHIITQLKEI